MVGLQQVFRLKIGVTAVLWCGPLLLLPLSVLGRLGLPAELPGIFIRLLGVAYASLLVSYAYGLASARNGRYPESTVWTGIVSNGGACMLLGVAGVEGEWTDWGAPARVLMWTSLIVTGLISGALVVAGPMAQAASRRHVRP